MNSMEKRTDIQLKTRIKELELDNYRLRSLLKKLEWIPEVIGDYCHCCERGRIEGHSPDCEMKLALVLNSTEYTTNLKRNMGIVKNTLIYKSNDEDYQDSLNFINRLIKDLGEAE